MIVMVMPEFNITNTQLLQLFDSCVMCSMFGYHHHYYYEIVMYLVRSAKWNIYHFT